jgi:serine/threonine protein phosphatase PrpC
VLVVCDGVSSSTHAEKASAIGARVCCDTLARFAREGDTSPVGRERAVATSIRAAHAAVCAHIFEPRLDGEPPGSTIVAALVVEGRVIVGWLGDSRAYFVGAKGGEQLTRDHSWLNDALARGDMTEEEALRQPLAHALTRCLGPLEVDSGLGFVEPDVRTVKVEGRGAVILTTDGFWNYYPSGAHVAKLVELDAPTRAIAERLTNHALACGGHDNITVAVCFTE